MITSIGHSTVDKVEVQGYQLADELIGEVDFGSMFFLLLTQRLPEANEQRLFNGILVALADHGLTPTALAARLTYTGAPDAVQGAIAAGILGAGSVFLGVFENAARMLIAALDGADTSPEHDLDGVAARIVDDHERRGERIPGLGHPLHRHGDPRTARLIEIARSSGLLGRHTQLMLLVQGVAAASSGKQLPLNAGGVCGALLCDMGIEPSVLRGVAVVSRAAGVTGHIAEEARAPMGRTIWDWANASAQYVPRRRSS
ncbi:MAG: citryl-CoA lyase [Pseudonocardia sp. SCN 72-86]|nr:MAG: citryl-CoA lyase [Pseudonocardia sp. SCN 72-86]